MELFRALALLAEPPRKESARVAAALDLGQLPSESLYTETFVFQLYPYASVYLGPEGMMGGEARDRVAGFWRALQLTPPAEPDHLSVMLALYAELAASEEREGDALARSRLNHARAVFLWEHLLSWLPTYLQKLEEIAGPFYRKWGETLRQALSDELQAMNQPAGLPLHLREPLHLIDPREHSTEEFLQSLLAPARSGMILVRRDLARAGRLLGLGLRMGERKFILRSLFNQDARGILDWLLEESVLWRKRHQADKGALGAISAAWTEKTEHSARLLRELSSSAAEMMSSPF